MLDPGWVRFMLDLVGDDSAVRALLLDKPSRREQRRARKAAKNLAMYKTAGRRPWVVSYHAMWPAYGDCNDSDRDTLLDDMLWVNRKHLRLLRERSGFLAMSRLATWIQRGDDGAKSCSELSDEIWSGIV